jgi:hypothetical protein
VRKNKWFGWFMGIWTLGYFTGGLMLQDQRLWLIQLFTAIFIIGWMLKGDLDKKA